MTELLASEVSKGYLIGPFSASPFPIHRVNPIGIAEGKYSLKKRLIVDMSAPHDNLQHASLNSLIDKDTFSLKYVRIDDAIDIIKQLGKGCWMCKTDITDAFKQVPVHPSIWHLQGIQWQRQLYYYTRLVFGSRSSPKIFDDLASVICWIAQRQYGIAYILHLLDDFICFADNVQVGHYNMAALCQVFSDLNIPLSQPKTVGPVALIEYLGITLDSVRMRASLPVAKVNRIVDIIDRLFDMDVITKRDLLVVLGHLNFAMRVIRPGRSFISYLLKVAHGRPNLTDLVFLTEECRLDLSMWRHFLQSWNGVSLFLEDVIASPDFELFTDAAASVGHGGFFQGRWFAERWPTELFIGTVTAGDMSIALMELYPIVVAAVVWGREWSKKSIVFHCDNQATVFIINKGRSPSAFIMKLIRKLTLTAAIYNFVFHAQHVPGKLNVISDALSRQQIQKFRRLVPTARLVPTPCPPISHLTFPPYQPEPAR